MRIGKPFVLPPISGKGEQRRKDRQKNADLIMYKIAALLPPEYHGVYSEKSDLESVLEPSRVAARKTVKNFDKGNKMTAHSIEKSQIQSYKI